MVTTFSKEQKNHIISLIQRYFDEERNEPLGNLEAEFLLDFFLEKVGPFIYNQALHDTQSYLIRRLADIEDGLIELEQPIPRK